MFLIKTYSLNHYPKSYLVKNHFLYLCTSFLVDLDISKKKENYSVFLDMFKEKQAPYIWRCLLYTLSQATATRGKDHYFRCPKSDVWGEGSQCQLRHCCLSVVPTSLSILFSSPTDENEDGHLKYKLCKYKFVDCPFYSMEILYNNLKLCLVKP